MPKSSTSFKPGQSGNLSGRPRVVAEVLELARQHSGSAISTLAKIMNDERVDPRARVAAANALLDRGFGKPSQDIKLGGESTHYVKRLMLDGESEGKA